MLPPLDLFVVMLFVVVLYCSCCGHLQLQCRCRHRFHAITNHKRIGLLMEGAACTSMQLPSFLSGINNVIFFSWEDGIMDLCHNVIVAFSPDPTAASLSSLLSLLLQLWCCYFCLLL
jgi:hypothetical protein